jgi:hypothetical protein
MSRKTFALALASALLGTAAPAQAATTLGTPEITTQNVVAMDNGGTFVQSGAAGPAYVAPTAGILTSFSVRYVSSTDSIFRFKTIRGAKIHTTLDVPAPAAGGMLGERRTYAIRVPVAPGDTIAIGSPWGRIGIEQHVGSDVEWSASDFAPAQTVVVNGSPYSDFRMIFSATLESDGDNDGYGDETQDACPSVAARQAAPCSVDLAAAARFVPASVIAGEAALLDVDVTSPGYAQETSVSIDLPPGMEVLAAGDCTGGDPLTCPVSVAPGQTRRIGVLVRTAAAGDYAVTARTLAPGDANPLNDAAAATLKVTAAAAALCTVPKLKKLTRARAKARLVAAGCALGKITGAKRGKVRTQKVPAGTKVAAGTKVGVRLAKPRRR